MPVIKQKSFYAFMGALIIASWTYFVWFFSRAVSDSSGFVVCHIKRVTDVPCPSCGITRSVTALFQGDLAGALILNPLGLLAGIFLLVVPVWLALDLIRGRNGMYRAFLKTESILKKYKWFSFFLVLVLAINWAWLIINHV